MLEINKIYDFCKGGCLFADYAIESIAMRSGNEIVNEVSYLKCKNEDRCQKFLKANKEGI